MQKVVIIDYGAGNIFSVRAALQRLGVEAILSKDHNEILSADKVIFPGVGHAATAMEHLANHQLVEIIPQIQVPVLGICLGMQLLCQHSEEGNVKGIGVFDAEVKRFKHNLKIPHMGWNTLKNIKGPLFDGLEDSDHVYCVHSYYVTPSDQDLATMEYGHTISVAKQKDNFFATQFHPEKSGLIGHKILQNFLKLSI